ncbi:integrator complex subunit 4 [Entomortierella parvispora]|uniref:Integrator complex subunit 4 n=1 Tax=Entomortierella parvispora TaxID=205924 RepID=A0A9P3LZU8_9FUNG|nr:integrator complex subunit 4 [Entomortierella parvispora]
MKRGAQETASSNGKHPRLNPSSVGSSTVVQPRLVLRPDASSMTGLEIEGGQEDTDSGSDHSSIGTEEESNEDDATSTEDLFRLFESKRVRVRTKALKLLLNRLSKLTPDDRIRLMQAARRKLYTEDDKGARILLVQVLQNVMEYTDIDGREVIEDLLNQLRADSTEVRVQVYDSISHLVKIGRLSGLSASNVNTANALITMAVSELTDRHHRIRSAVLQLIAQLAPLTNMDNSVGQPKDSKSEQGQYSQNDLQVIISNYVTDPEPRVRKSALRSLLELHSKGFKLALTMYDVAIVALVDDYQEVRMEGLDLVYILSTLYPNQVVQNPLATQLQATRLVDDAFIRVCDMVNDSSMIVRAKACSFLGRFKSVSYKFLSQTFSKQIMARLKVDVAPKNLAAGPAQKQAQRAKLIATPEGDQDVTAQQVRLLDSGACGAFVHGLEDEYQDVRNAAINSICELCLHNPAFALLALDYMVDMFMDEIDYVRLNALTSLCKIGNRAPLVFDTEQLQIALGVLEDADRDVRESTHRMLQVVTMAAADGMTSFLASMESNMRRFPEDQLSIYQCIRTVGRQHGAFIEHLVPEILKLDSQFLPSEENVEDMLYGGHLILIFNAAIPNPNILRILPKYAFRHYTYLRDKYPNCFPEPTEIPCPGTQPLRDVASALTMTITQEGPNGMDVDHPIQTPTTLSSSAYATTIAALRDRTEQDAEEFYTRAISDLERIHVLFRRQHGQTRRGQRPSYRAGGSSSNVNHRNTLIQQMSACQRDLRYIFNVHTRQGRNAEFASMYLECCELLLRIQDSFSQPSFITSAPALSAQLLRLSYSMDHTFLGLDAGAKVAVRYFRVLANLVWFFGMVQQKDGARNLSQEPSQGVTRVYLQSMLQQAIKRVTDLQREMDAPEIDQSSMQAHRVILGDLRMSMSRAYASPSTMDITRMLSNVESFLPMRINFENLSLQRISAQVNRPLQNLDNPVDIHPSFPFMLAVEGVIHNISDTAGIALQITFPQDVIRHFYPPPDHFTRIMDDQDSSEDMGMANEADDGVDSTMTSVNAPTAAGSGSASTAANVGSFRLRTSIEIYPEAAWGTTPTALRIALSRSFQPDLTGHDEFICRFAEEMVSERRQGQDSTGNQTIASQSDLRSGPLSRQLEGGAPSTSFNSGSSSTSDQSGQSTLEVSQPITYYVARRAMFAGP